MSTPANKIKKKLPSKPGKPNAYTREKSVSEDQRNYRTRRTEQATAADQDWSNRNLPKSGVQRRKVTPSGNQAPPTGEMNRTGAGRIYTDSVRWSLDEKERIRNRYNAKREEMRNLGSRAVAGWETRIKQDEDRDMAEVDAIVERDFQNYKKSPKK